MVLDIERVLAGSALRYTKEVDSAGNSSFSVPFDIPSGPIVVRLMTTRDRVIPYTFVRALDELPGLKKPLLEQLLRLNSRAEPARVFILTLSDEEEVDWVGTNAVVDLEGATPDVVLRAIHDTAELANKVLETIAVGSTSSPKQLT